MKFFPLRAANAVIGSWKWSQTVAHSSAQRGSTSRMRSGAKNSSKDASSLLCTCKLQQHHPVSLPWPRREARQRNYLCTCDINKNRLPWLVMGRVSCELQQTNFDKLTRFCFSKPAKKKCVCEAGMWSLPRGHELLAVRDFEVGMKAKFTWHGIFLIAASTHFQILHGSVTYRLMRRWGIKI